MCFVGFMDVVSLVCFNSMDIWQPRIVTCALASNLALMTLDSNMLYGRYIAIVSHPPWI